MRVVEVRDAHDDDWPVIWPFFAETVAAGETYAFPDGLDQTTARPWWMERPPARTVVAVEDGLVLGSAKYGPNRPGRGAHVGTASFLVAPAARGRGVGRRLGEHVVEALRREGYRAVQFNAVVETNTVAVALWRSLGFEVVGTVPEAFVSRAHGPVGLHVMHLRLQP